MPTTDARTPSGPAGAGAGVRDRGRLRRAGRGRRPGRRRAGAAGPGGPRAGRGAGPLAAAGQRRRGRARGRVRRGRPPDAGGHRRPPGPGHGPGRHGLRRPRAPRRPRGRPGQGPGRGGGGSGSCWPSGPSLAPPGRSVAAVLAELPLDRRRRARPSPPGSRCRPASRSPSWPPPRSAMPAPASRPARACGSPAATSGSPCGWPSGSPGPCTWASPSRRSAWSDRGVRVAVEGAELEAEACLLAVPASVTGRIRFDPPLPAWKAEALERVVYGHAAKLFVPLRQVPPPSAVLSVPDLLLDLDRPRRRRRRPAGGERLRRLGPRPGRPGGRTPARRPGAGAWPRSAPTWSWTGARSCPPGTTTPGCRPPTPPAPPPSAPTTPTSWPAPSAPSTSPASTPPAPGPASWKAPSAAATAPPPSCSPPALG